VIDFFPEDLFGGLGEQGMAYRLVGSHGGFFISESLHNTVNMWLARSRQRIRGVERRGTKEAWPFVWHDE